MNLKLSLCLALVLSGTLFDCFSTAHAGVLSPDTTAVVTGNTEFALNLYEKLRTSEDNICFSPYSFSTALAMTCGGARGVTEQQMVVCRATSPFCAASASPTGAATTTSTRNGSPDDQVKYRVTPLQALLERQNLQPI
jgi:Serpin (serine protease inhibitor)